MSLKLRASKWAHRTKIAHTYNLMTWYGFAEWAWLAGVRYEHRQCKERVANAYKAGKKEKERVIYMAELEAWQNGYSYAKKYLCSDSRQELVNDARKRGHRQKPVAPTCPKNINSKPTLNDKFKEKEKVTK